MAPSIFLEPCPPGDQAQSLGLPVDGMAAKARISPGRPTQACLDVVKTDCSGCGKEGSPKAPTATPISCGMRSGSQNTVDPHFGQKWKVTSFPKTELRVTVFDLPSATVTALRSKKAATPNRLPVRRWQSSQWQIEMRLGPPSQRSCSLPQAQLATRSVMKGPPSNTHQGDKRSIFRNGRGSP